MPEQSSTRFSNSMTERAAQTLFLCLTVAIAACSTDGGDRVEVDERDASPPDAASDMLAGTDASADAGRDVQDDDAEMGVDAGDAGVTALLTRAPFAVPRDVLDGSNLQSCAVFEDQRCVGGVLQSCELYSESADDFVAPDPVLQRVLHYDRWYDLHHQPQGQTVERVYRAATPPGTPESVWGSDATFAGYAGMWDAAIWNGAALVAASMRYLQTGTDADYDRMERKVRDMLLQFDVTQIPGYLARYHFLLVDPATPQRQDVVLHHSSVNFDHRHRLMESPQTVRDLPAIYVAGFTDDDGNSWTGTPMWGGNPSIDQYSGPRTAFPIAYELLRDEELKSRMREHLVCYLNRLERIEIRNLQRNPDAIQAISDYFVGGGDLQLDPDDPDLTQIDTIVGYVQRQINTLNEDTFDRSCPSGPQYEPTTVVDAAAPSFTLDLLGFATDLNGVGMEKRNSIDHFYGPNIRGADAIHLMQLAALAYHWTGEDQYRAFLFDELIGNLGALEIANTAGALVLPRFCRKFYGHHISFTPTWGFLTFLQDQPLRTAIETVMHDEMWLKEMSTQNNAKFNLFYAGEVRPEIATGRAGALASALRALNEMGGNGGVLDDPRRTYSIDATALGATAPDGNELLCPTQQEIDQCERDVIFAGVTVPGPDITAPCSGNRPECPAANGECVDAQMRDALPMHLREYADFAWQRNPYALGGAQSMEGRRQSAGLDFTEEYWVARQYGVVPEGSGTALAWRDVGDCN